MRDLPLVFHAINQDYAQNGVCALAIYDNEDEFVIERLRPLSHKELHRRMNNVRI